MFVSILFTLLFMDNNEILKNTIVVLKIPRGFFTPQVWNNQTMQKAKKIIKKVGVRGVVNLTFTYSKALWPNPGFISDTSVYPVMHWSSIPFLCRDCYNKYHISRCQGDWKIVKTLHAPLFIHPQRGSFDRGYVCVCLRPVWGIQPLALQHPCVWNESLNCMCVSWKRQHQSELSCDCQADCP